MNALPTIVHYGTCTTIIFTNVNLHIRGADWEVNTQRLDVLGIYYLLQLNCLKEKKIKIANNFKDSCKCVHIGNHFVTFYTFLQIQGVS